MLDSTIDRPVKLCKHDHQQVPSDGGMLLYMILLSGSKLNKRCDLYDLLKIRKINDFDQFTTCGFWRFYETMTHSITELTHSPLVRKVLIVIVHVSSRIVLWTQKYTFLKLFVAK